MMIDIAAPALSLPTALTGLIGQAPDAAQAAQDAAEATGASGWIVFAIFLAIVCVPFLLGWAIAKALKLSDVRARIGLVILAATIGATPFVSAIINGTTQKGLSVTESLRQSIKLGVDLAGGTNLVYQVKENTEKEVTPEILDNMVGSITKRINPSGTEEVTVRRVGEARIEIIVPGADPEKVRRIKSRVVQLGSLEFDLLANSVDHSQWIAQARELSGTDTNVRQGTQVVAAWKNVARDAEGNWKLQNADATRYVTADGEILPNPPEEATQGISKQVLVVLEPQEQRVTGEYVSSARVSADQSGRPAVAFNFNSTGGQLFLQLTSANLPNESTDFHRQLAILLDGEVHSAPSINEPIAAQGQITGRFTQEEVRELVDVLNAGALEVPLDPEPVSEFTISPLLGQDTINKAITAILWAAIGVLIITAVYYLLAGLIADFCLMLNLLLLLGIMSLIDATFTLPGLAGVVLTFGMAVDANVLIFERIREELGRGSSLRMAIQNGFDRALSAIVDSNVTTLITSVILYLIGTDAVKGFAVALFIGIVVSLFTSLFVSRLIFDIIDRKRWIRKLPMNLLLSNPHINWLKHKAGFLVASVVVIGLGIGMLFYRGTRMLDIDFLGGTMVTFQLTEDATTGKIRDILQERPKFEDNLSVERLVLMGEEEGQAGRRFRVRTTALDEDSSQNTEGANAESASPGQSQGGEQEASVKDRVAEALAEGGLQIRRVTIETSEVGPIVEGNEDPTFEDGFSAEITLEESASGRQEEFGTETVASLLAEQFQSGEEGEGQAGYDQVSELIRVVGLAGSGEQAGETEAKSFSHFRIDVAPPITEQDFASALQSLQMQLADNPVFDEVNSFDSSVAGETQRLAIMAIVSSWLAIIGYLWFRFQNIAFGLAAVTCLVHDVLITLGILALASYIAGPLGITILGLEEFKINLPMVAAVLTLIGYSINDTIVVFDRIREVRGKNPAMTEAIINSSLNQTLSRTLLTSATTLVVTIVLYFFGGEGIHGFAFILTIGIFVGTYSSIYVASPTLNWLINRNQPRAAGTPRKREAVAT